MLGEREVVVVGKSNDTQCAIPRSRRQELRAQGDFVEACAVTRGKIS